MTTARQLFVITTLGVFCAVGRGQSAPAAEAVPVERASAPAFTAVSPADRNKTLGVGDQVTLEIMEDRTEPIVRRVTDTGEIDIPYIGRLRAEGKTTSQLAAEIKRRLESEYYYTATIRMGIDQVNRAAAMGHVFVSGEVRNPGPQEFYTGDELTASAVILKAGSFTQFADRGRVKLVRKIDGGGSRQFELDMKAVLEQGQVEKDMKVQDGDYLIVKRRLFNW